MGGGLATALAAVGHEVVFGVRDPGSEKCRAAMAAAAGSTATSPAEAVAGADVVVFALRWPAVPGIVATLPRLDGRVVIDAMNRFDGDPVRSTTEDLADLSIGTQRDALAARISTLLEGAEFNHDSVSERQARLLTAAAWGLILEARLVAGM